MPQLISMKWSGYIKLMVEDMMNSWSFQSGITPSFALRLPFPICKENCIFVLPSDEMLRIGTM